MANRNDTAGSLGRVLPVMLILLLLSILLSLYFFKYIPQQQNAFNGRAFMELGQIERAIQSRNQGYRLAIGTFLDHRRQENPLIRSFNFSDPLLAVEAAGFRRIGQTTIRKDNSGALLAWQIAYPLIPKTIQGSMRPDTMSIGLETVIAPIINTYQDIFDGYLLIRDTHLDSLLHTTSAWGDRLHQGEIIFNSGGLAVDYLVNTDSLLKKNDGFSLLDLHDVSIEGNPYKLFLYPFPLGKDRIILAGLIELSKYNTGYKDIPFTYIAVVSILVLLLITLLPILKIFILGPFERITGLNIRMIIGTYFVTAFVAFFLFSWLFLLRVHKVNNRNNLDAIATRVEGGFRSELSRACAQLDDWDCRYAEGLASDRRLLQAMRTDGIAIGNERYDSILIDQILQPDQYLFADNVFWIDSTGQWTAGWNLNRQYEKTLLLKVTDRDYFNDFQKGRFMILDRGKQIDSFTMQPTLSKLDGEYTITVLKRAVLSSKGKDSTFPGRGKDSAVRILHPSMVGMSGKLTSVTNTLLPAGYNFSIINEDGDVLYDGKPGRALLSNILQEVSDPSGIRVAARTHSARYFPVITMKGQEVALLATPMRGFPYTLITYYKLAGADDSQVHMIFLSAFFAACILGLLILSTMINESSMKKPSLLSGSGLNGDFGWLRPLQEKNRYYLFIIAGMLSLLAVYLAAWLVVENLQVQWEFALFYISLVLPFYLAILYFWIKENQKARPVITFLILVIGISHLAILPYNGRQLPLLVIALFVQCLFITVIICCRQGFRNSLSPRLLRLLRPVKNGLLLCQRGWIRLMNGVRMPSKTKNWERNYSLAVLLGVYLIIIIPACGIFWLFVRQETALQLNSARLNTALTAGKRNLAINQRMSAFKPFGSADSTVRNRFLRAVHHLKFHEGIYLAQERILDSASVPGLVADWAVAPEYNALHRTFFPADSTELAWPDTPYRAGDSSWQLTYQPSPGKAPGKEYFGEGQHLLGDSDQFDQLDHQPIRLDSGPRVSESSFWLMVDYSTANGFPYLLLFFACQALGLYLVYLLTVSLARRIFLLKGTNWKFCPNSKRDGVQALFEKFARDAGADHIWAIGVEERQLSPDKVASEETILCNLWQLEVFYQAVWWTLPPMKKFILYDFALDGFTNYKNADDLFELYNMGLLRLVNEGKDQTLTNNNKLVFMTTSFREWIIRQADDPDISMLIKRAGIKGPWQNFKLPLMILLAAFGLFLFFTQDALYQKIGGLITSFGSLSNILLPLFGKGSGKDTDAAK